MKPCPKKCLVVAETRLTRAQRLPQKKGASAGHMASARLLQDPLSASPEVKRALTPLLCHSALTHSTER